ncbi:hypothetical protein FSP39_010735 [Pinctada imbricata]|uniref:G-protein coupled receptors family 1 profile domain-containing protein n=1 Tax=Pinctada imbricata TaxID=66713 RepID=A0AA88XN84_PINIB|nr:hypothetical protein FSP39_010735 [Pinctada imbricata]
MEFVRVYSVLAANISLVTIAAERYIAVARPMKLMSSRTKRLVIIVLSLVLIPISIPGGMTYTIMEKDVCSGSNFTSSENISTDSNTSGECSKGMYKERFCYYTTDLLTPFGAELYKVIQMTVFGIGIFLIVLFYGSVYGILHRRAKARRRKNEEVLGKLVSSTSGALEQSFNQNGFRITQVQPFPNNISTNQDNHRKSSLSDSNFTTTNSFKPKRTDHANLIKEDYELKKIEQNGRISTGASKERRSVFVVDKYFATGRKQTCNSRRQSYAIATKKIAFVEDSESRSVYENWEQHSEKLSKLFLDSAEEGKIKSTQLRRGSLVQRKTSTMLFICTIIFLVSWIPFWIDVFNITNSRSFRYLFLTGHVTNPIVYGIVNTEIRKALLKIVKCQ